eukprot:m.45755 g.45755  ORF g.45755 m.45755 type:complete len:748 (+) comp11043_c0_seq1:52-2295(+)
MSEPRKSAIPLLASSANTIADADVLRFCDQKRKELKTGDRSGECLEILRQLSAYFALSQKDFRLPKQFTELLYGLLSEPEQGPPALRVLCFMILQELLPSEVLKIASFAPPVERAQIPHLLSLLVQQGNRPLLKETHRQQITKILATASDSDLHVAALTAAVALARRDPTTFTHDQAGAISAFLCVSLRSAALGVGAGALQEMDGRKARDFFTVLCLARTHTPEQMLNMQAFSALQCWLSSIATLPDEHYAAVLPTDFREAIIEYCLRLLDQGTTKLPEDKPLAAADRVLRHASLAEAVRILDLVCQRARDQVARVGPAIRRLLGRGGEVKASVHMAVLRFLVHNMDYAVLDLEQACANCFGGLLRDKFGDPLVAAATFTFALDNSTLLHRAGFFCKYFPNLLKIVAWSPRTFLSEALDLLPSLMHPTTAIELFHSLLDLPCLSIALEMSASGEMARIISSNSIASALFAYVLRDEGGLGGTIDRLSDLHTLLRPGADGLRARTTAELVPLLLHRFFDSLRECEHATVLGVFQAMLERIVKLFPVEPFAASIREVLAERVVSLFQGHPGLLYDSSKECLEFVTSLKHSGDGRAAFFSHVVWAIGEYTTPRMDHRCTTDHILPAHTTLEDLTFELNMSLQSATAPQDVCTAKLLCVLMAALAKLATACQDIAPRVRLCLTKIAKQYPTSPSLEPASRRVVVARAVSLCNILLHPEVAATVLAVPPILPDLHTSHASAHGLVRAADRLL